MNDLHHGGCRYIPVWLQPMYASREKRGTHWHPQTIRIAHHSGYCSVIHAKSAVRFLRDILKYGNELISLELSRAQNRQLCRRIPFCRLVRDGRSASNSWSICASGEVACDSPCPESTFWPLPFSLDKSNQAHSNEESVSCVWGLGHCQRCPIPRLKVFAIYPGTSTTTPL